MKKLFVLMLMTTILYTGYNLVQDDTVYHYEQITVHTGDTMWAIADRWSEQGEDVREVIYRICETNALDNTNLKPGQKLMIPVKMQFVDQLMVAEATDTKG
ncbi:LysM peptidoglycan-binding domain-containing protein [Phascolarctobacterium sp.]|mgnify:CR=1 FL=1|uniref:cell division suppressor protein YneA n=1 Tax=Phascolarctobacterium sp. TaxID=2049039 RepID=UPI0015AB9E40|nr:LysM peptidoglycan-binding domain-containing protein [uncultured Phascolarctobacterium sp.]